MQKVKGQCVTGFMNCFCLQHQYVYVHPEGIHTIGSCMTGCKSSNHFQNTYATVLYILTESIILGVALEMKYIIKKYKRQKPIYLKG